MRGPLKACEVFPLSINASCGTLRYVQDGKATVIRCDYPASLGLNYKTTKYGHYWPWTWESAAPTAAFSDIALWLVGLQLSNPGCSSLPTSEAHITATMPRQL